MLDRWALVGADDACTESSTDTVQGEDFLFSLWELEGNSFLGLFLYSGKKKKINMN